MPDFPALCSPRSALPRPSTTSDVVVAHGPTGAPPEVTGVDVVRVPDGRIAARYPFLDGSGEWPRMKLAESAERFRSAGALAREQHTLMALPTIYDSESVIPMRSAAPVFDHYFRRR